MSKIHIVFTFEENYAPAASVAIQSLLAHKKPSTQYVIYVFYGNLKDTTRAQLNKLTPISWVKMDAKIFEGVPCSERYSLPVWYGSTIPEVLPNLKRVIYSDVDVLFKCDLTDVYNMNLHGKCCAAVPERYNDYDTTKYPHCDEMGDVIFIGDLMVLDIAKLRKVRSMQSMFEIGRKYGHELPSLQMAVLNIVAKNEMEPISIAYDIPAFAYHDPYKGIFATDYNDVETMAKAMQNPLRIHYTCDDEEVKIWEMPPEQVPEEYLQYLLKSGLYRYAQTGVQNS